MFAGPNGSGKSTLKDVIPPHLLGSYLNADDIERALKSESGYDLSLLPVSFTLPEMERSFAYFVDSGARSEKSGYVVENNKLYVRSTNKLGYQAAAFADLLRHKLLAEGASFSFETVMSHPSKVELLSQAKGLGYRTYLYYVATEDPEINIYRVQSRVKSGGHDVPEIKIRDRYQRSLQLLPGAIQNSSRAYVFDNSATNGDHVWIAEFDGATQMELKVEPNKVPKWYEKYVLNRLV